MKKICEKNVSYFLRLVFFSSASSLFKTMNWISFVTLRLFWIIQLSQGQKPETLGLDCCQRIRLSGSSIMTNFQPLAIGVYEATGGKINNRLVYKHTEGMYVYDPPFFDS